MLGSYNRIQAQAYFSMHVLEKGWVIEALLMGPAMLIG